MANPKKLQNGMLWEKVKPYIFSKTTDPNDFLVDFVSAQLQLNRKTMTKEDFKELKFQITKFLKYVKKQLKTSAYKIDRFNKKCEIFLAQDFPFLPHYAESNTTKEIKPLSIFAKILPFRAKKERARRAETANIRSDNDNDAIVQSLIQILKRQGQKDIAKAMERMLYETPIPSTSKREDDQERNVISETTPEEALCLILNKNLSVDTYKALRKRASEKRARKLYPTYHEILSEKKKVARLMFV